MFPNLMFAIQFGSFGEFTHTLKSVYFFSHQNINMILYNTKKQREHCMRYLPTIHCRK